MKLGMLYNNRRGLQWAYALNLKSGAKAFKLRRALEKANEEIISFEKMKDATIKSYGKDSVGKDDPEYDAIIAKLDEAMAEEVDIKFDPLIEESDLENVEVSVAVLDSIIRLGLMKDPDAEEPKAEAPSPEQAAQTP